MRKTCVLLVVNTDVDFKAHTVIQRVKAGPHSIYLLSTVEKFLFDKLLFFSPEPKFMLDLFFLIKKTI